MTDWKKYQFSEFLKQTKDVVTISDKQYSLITITNQSKVRLRNKISGSLIKSIKGFIVKKSDFVYSRLAVHTGAYGIVPDDLDGALVTNEMPSFVIDENIIIPKLFLLMLKLSYIKEQVRRLTSGMGRVRVKEKDFLGLYLYLPKYENQLNILKKLESNNSKIKSNLLELGKQQSLLKLLRQSILQEAVEGKLTAEWRSRHPELVSGSHHAARLLEKIKADKEKLTKDTKRTKKEKELPPINADEIPFDLPEGWVWERLGILIEDLPRNGTSPIVRNSQPFYITRNELEKSRTEKDNYYLYRVYNYNEEADTAELLLIKGELSALCNFPTLYKVSLKD